MKAGNWPVLLSRLVFCHAHGFWTLFTYILRFLTLFNTWVTMLIYRHTCLMLNLDGHTFITLIIHNIIIMRFMQTDSTVAA